jgi:hypothetical protein
MSTPVITENSAHDEVSLLLPWYVNGTLGSRQKALVNEHVRSCIACRRELATECRTLDAFRNESPLDHSVIAGFERLHCRITARTAPHSRRSVSAAAGSAWTRVLDVARTFTGARLRTALVAVPLAAIAIAFGLRQIPQLQSPDRVYVDTGTASAVDGYQTLSSPIAGVANPDDVQMIFTRGTSIEAIEGLLESLPAKIVDGPNSAGVYTVRLLDVSAESERQAAILALRDRQEVFFAEPAQPMSVSNPGKAQPQ